MTVAVAVRKNGRTVLAADSLVNFAGQRFSPDNCQFHKVQRVGESLLAVAGWSLYTEMLQSHLASNPPPQLRTEQEVFAFFLNFWRAIRQEYPFRTSAGNGADLDSTFVLANRNGIYRVSSDFDVTYFTAYTAIGSGGKYALGALKVLYAQLDDPAEIARRAVQVGIDFDVYCGGQIDVGEVGEDVASTPSASSAARLNEPKVDGAKGDAAHAEHRAAAAKAAAKEAREAREERGGQGGARRGGA
ncbi:MAG TPA: hypothetical protein VEI02_00355 [Planctomycetota bacterium]|nr:hypothetical protein [Planctomycetota bacterium]